MSNAIFAQGTLLKIGDGAGTEVFTTIAEVTDIGGPELTLEVADVTNHSSTAGWREKIGAILDGGQVSLSINYIPTDATHNNTAGLVRDLRSRTKRNFQLVFSDSGNTTWAFTALVVSFSPAEPIDGQLAAEVSLDITGQPTLV
jgi:predicted secreted protein